MRVGACVLPGFPRKWGMFLLGGLDFPKDAASLVSAIEQGLHPLGLGAGRVQCEGAFPALSLLRCDLSGAVFRSEHRAATAAGALQPGFFARRVEVACDAATLGGLGFSASLALDDAVFAFARDAAGAPMLALEQCGAGVLELAVTRGEFEKLVFSLAAKAAEEQGAEVKAASVTWEASGERAVALRVVARAKAMFMETSVSARGRVEVTDALAVVVSGLSCSGEGMVGNLAATFLRKEIPKYEGRSVSLAGVFGGIRLKDVGLRCEPDILRVRAHAAPGVG